MLVSAALIIVLSMPAVLGYNVLSGIQPLGEGSTIMDLEDFIVSNNLLPLGSLGYVLFLSIALFATGCILVGYIGLQSDITNSIKRIASLERELNDLKLANDEEYNRITSNVDLEEVRRIAIQELGMQYAEEGQIVVFQSENNDYVKQIAAIPD